MAWNSAPPGICCRPGQQRPRVCGQWLHAYAYLFYIAELAARLGLSIQHFDLSTQSYGKGTRRHAAYVLDGTIAGVALHATEDALEPGFVKAMSQPML